MSKYFGTHLLVFPIFAKNSLRMPSSSTTKKRSTSTKKTTGTKKTSKTKSQTKITLSFLSDEKFIKISGFFLILLGIYLAVTFTSYLYNHFESGPDIRHWTGGLGYKIADQIVKIGFGASSYFFCYWFIIFGIQRLFNREKKWFLKSFRYTLVLMIWTSLVFGFLFPDNSNFSILAGFFGLKLNDILHQFIGLIGTGIVILIILISITTIAYNIPFKWFKPNPNKKKSSKSGATDFDENKNRDVANDVVTIAPAIAKEQTTEKIENDNDITIENNVENNSELTVSAEEEQTTEFEFDDQLNVKKQKKANAEPDFVIEENPTPIPSSTEESPQAVSQQEEEHHGIETEYDPRLDLRDYQYPETDLLVSYGDDTIKIQKEELESNKNKIVETLNHYSIKIDKIKATIGPTVTLYEIIPAPGVRISKIKNLEDDIALSLSAMGIRIIAPIPGKGTIGIEVPNSNKQIVSMKTLLNSDKFRNSNYELPVAIGKTISNEIFITDLTKMPHLLMAGATGQGKSVGLNCIIASLLYKKHPAELKFVLVDPKKVELSLFSKIERHFLAKLPDAEEAIITDTRNVVRTLNSLCIEMDQRYDLLKNAQVRNIKEYNVKFKSRKLNPENGHHYLPYIVLLIDEFADLIMTAGKEVESPIARLAQLARAVGIHLIIATQRPSVNIITGTIKANFPARIAFRVISKIDSRTILDYGGADQLIGRGDMLLSTGGDLTRLQCAFVDTPEVEAITEFIGSQRAYSQAFILPEYLDEESESNKDITADEYDELFEDAARMVVSHQHGSTSLLQRKLKLGYNRAGRIIDQLEAAGIVGPFEGSKAREVRIANEMALEQHLLDIKNKEIKR